MVRFVPQRDPSRDSRDFQLQTIYSGVSGLNEGGEFQPSDQGSGIPLERVLELPAPPKLQTSALRRVSSVGLPHAKPEIKRYISKLQSMAQVTGTTQLSPADRLRAVVKNAQDKKEFLKVMVEICCFGRMPVDARPAQAHVRRMRRSQRARQPRSARKPRRRSCPGPSRR